MKPCKHLQIGPAYLDDQLLGWKCLDCSHWLSLSDWLKMLIITQRPQANRSVDELVQEILRGDNEHESTCPACGKPAIGRNRHFNEYTCGFHYWKVSEGRVVVLPPVGEKHPMITDFELQKGVGTVVEIIGANEEDELWLIIDEDKLVRMIQIAFDCPKFTINDLIDALQAAEARQA